MVYQILFMIAIYVFFITRLSACIDFIHTIYINYGMITLSVCVCVSMCIQKISVQVILHYVSNLYIFLLYFYTT